MSEEPAQVITPVVATDTEYYLSGSLQAGPPEGTLPAGTNVTLLEEGGSYCRVPSEGGIDTYDSTDNLQPLERRVSESQ